MVADVAVSQLNGYACVVYLRGGGSTGAVYHVYSDQPIDVDMSSNWHATFPIIATTEGTQIGWNGGTADKPTYKWTAPAAKSSPDTARLDSLQPMKVANNATTKANSATIETQYIYISKASGTSSVSANTTWVTESGDKQNTWSTKRPTYNSSYPVLFVAKQNKTVAGTVTCTTPVKDDTTTVIDGGHITTGTIDASKATITNINASNITSGTLSADRISADSLFSKIITVAGETDSEGDMSSFSNGLRFKRTGSPDTYDWAMYADNKTDDYNLYLTPNFTTNSAKRKNIILGSTGGITGTKSYFCNTSILGSKVYITANPRLAALAAAGGIYLDAGLKGKVTVKHNSTDYQVWDDSMYSYSSAKVSYSNGNVKWSKMGKYYKILCDGGYATFTATTLVNMENKDISLGAISGLSLTGNNTGMTYVPVAVHFSGNYASVDPIRINALFYMNGNTVHIQFRDFIGQYKAKYPDYDTTNTVTFNKVGFSYYQLSGDEIVALN